MKRFLGLCTRVLLVAVLLITAVAFSGNARVRAEADKDEPIKIGLGSERYVYDERIDYDYEYIYTSSNTKILKQDKDYPEYFDAIALGSAEVTITEVKDGKKTTLAVIKYEVVLPEINSELAEQTIYYEPGYYEFTNDDGYYEYALCDAFVNAIYLDELISHYVNTDYIFTCSDNSILDIKENGYLVAVKDTGSVDVTVAYTYNKKKYEIGTIKIDVKERPKAFKDGEIVDAYIADSFYESEYTCGKSDYLCVVSDTTLTSKEVEAYLNNEKKLPGTAGILVPDEYYYEGYGSLVPMKVGQCYLYLGYKNYVTEKFEYDSYCIVDVHNNDKLVKTELPWDDYPEYYNLDKNGNYILYKGYGESFYFSTVPYSYTGKLTITSSNPKVAVVCGVDEEYKSLTLYGVGAGTAKITIAGGDCKRTFTVKVKKSSGTITVDNYSLFEKWFVIKQGNIDTAKIKVKSSNKKLVTMDGIYDIMTYETSDGKSTIVALQYFLEPKKAGNATITIYYDGKKAAKVKCVAK